MSKRKRVSLKERTTPCECCGFPLSQRHHLLAVAEFGDTDATAQLCANCHDLYHIIERSILHLAKHGNDEGYHNKLIYHVMGQFGDHPLWQNVYTLALSQMSQTQFLKIKVGDPDVDPKLTMVLKAYGTYQQIEAIYKAHVEQEDGNE